MLEMVVVLRRTDGGGGGGGCAGEGDVPVGRVGCGGRGRWCSCYC